MHRFTPQRQFQGNTGTPGMHLIINDFWRHTGNFFQFSLKEINELLALQAAPQAQCADVRERALTKIHEIEYKVRTLQA